MDISVWIFLVIVTFVSLSAYFILKQVSIYYAKVKSQKIKELFTKETGVNLENKSFTEVEKEFVQQIEQNKANKQANKNTKEE